MAKKFFTWGQNSFGSLPTGDTFQYDTLEFISNGWDKIELTSYGGIGLKSGKLYGWGITF